MFEKVIENLLKVAKLLLMGAIINISSSVYDQFVVLEGLCKAR